MEKRSLLRQEILTRKTQYNYGTIFLNLPFSYKWLSVFLIIIIFSIIFVINIIPISMSGENKTLFQYIFSNFLALSR